MLTYTTTGQASEQPAIILVHGLFGSGRNLGGIARRLGQGRQVVSVDMRNHGDSFHSDEHDYPALADDLAQVIAAHGGQADVVGHSMGGKSSMTLALTRPEMVRRLAVLDIAPLRYGHSQNDLIDAMEGLDLHDLTLRSEADRRLAAQIDEPGVRAFLLQSLDLKSQPPRWKMNLTALRRNMDRLTGWPQGLPTGSFHGPALFLAGGQSDYCPSEGVDAIRQYFPQAEIRFLEGAGHWLHAEKPQETGDALAAFLS